jgi:hypothetical protein
MRNVSDKICGENQNTDIICNNLFSKYCAIHEVMCENVVYPHRPQIIKNRKDVTGMPDN